MTDYLLFAGRIPLSDIKFLDSEEELNVLDLALEEEPVIQFNRPGDTTKTLATVPVSILDAFKK